MNKIDDGMNALQNSMNKAENYLSEQAATPIVGTVAGVAKMCMGLTQAVGGLGFGLAMALPSLFTLDSRSLRHSCM